MKLANLLDHHHKHASDKMALKDSLGDGFLCAKNRIYARVRQSSVNNGYQFSTKQNDAYRALPLSQLDEILKTKTIPYIDNVTVLETLEKRIPKQTEWNDISDNLKGNSVFHEACHALARRAANRLDPLLSLLLEESFANTCELLSILDAEDQVHRLFLELNSYVYMLDDRVHLANAAKDVGLEGLTRFMLLCYLHANFLREGIDYDRVAALSFNKKPDAKVEKNLRQLSKIAFKLNPRFREVTTQFYLKLHGVPAKLNVDFLSLIEASKPAREFLAAVSKL